jgi:hypothetical protein
MQLRRDGAHSHPIKGNSFTLSAGRGPMLDRLRKRWNGQRVYKSRQSTGIEIRHGRRSASRELMRERWRGERCCYREGRLANKPAAINQTIESLS